jgi:hypothetical protein
MDHSHTVYYTYVRTMQGTTPQRCGYLHQRSLTRRESRPRTSGYRGRRKTMKVLFVDDRVEEVRRQWEVCVEASESKWYVLLPLEPFDTVERTCELVREHRPDVVVLGYGLSKWPTTGADVLRALRHGGYQNEVVANSGGGPGAFLEAGVAIDGTADRDGELLAKALEVLSSQRANGIWRRVKYFKEMCGKGLTDDAIRLAASASSYLEAEANVASALETDEWSPELVEVALRAFLNTWQSYSLLHQYWVHSLSHLTTRLWDYRLDSWIEDLHAVAFRGAAVVNNPTCLERLAEDFAQHARFDDDPAAFGFRPENLALVNWDGYDFAKARLEAGRFKSEQALLRWKLRRPETHVAFDCDAQTDLVNIEGIRFLV